MPRPPSLRRLDTRGSCEAFGAKRAVQILATRATPLSCGRRLCRSVTVAHILAATVGTCTRTLPHDNSGQLGRVPVSSTPSGADGGEMKLHEAEARELLRRAGLPVPDGEVATTPTAARATAERLFAGGATQVVIKAQVLVGGRGKAGGVKLAGNAEEAEKIAAQILALTIKDLPVRRVLVAPAAEILREIYLSALIDRSSRGILLMASAAGGMEIEEVAAKDPTAIIRENAIRMQDSSPSRRDASGSASVHAVISSSSSSPSQRASSALRANLMLISLR